MNKRDKIGMLLWLIVAIIIGVVAMIPMVLREIYQTKKYKYFSLEWWDICRYGVVSIPFGSMLHWMILDLWFGAGAYPWWWAL